MPSEPTTPLLAMFVPASAAEWRALVESELEGSPFDKLITPTDAGIDLQPLYWPHDAADLPYTETVPGQPPFLRGAHPSSPADGPWLICQTIRAANPAEANALALAAVAHGATALDLAPTDPATLPAILAGIDPSAVALFIQSPPHQLATLLDTLATLPTPHTLRGAIGCDLLAEGMPVDASDLAASYHQIAHVTMVAAEHLPHIATLAADSRTYQAQGADPATELALALASAVAQLRALDSLGVPLAISAPRLRLSFAIGTQIFLEIAKLRAARLLWAQVIGACSLPPSAAPARIHAATSLRSATIADPHTNILRATAAAVAASLGGCESLDVTPFDAAFALPSDFSRRIALNTQHLLREESGMGEVLDPAGGSWYLEALTDALARKAWAQFQAIERQGGLAAALAAGLPQQQIAAQAQQRAQDLATRRQILIGVNQYVDPQLPWPAEILPSAHRDASPFEALRALAAAQAEPPRAFLAIVGPVARLAARIEFVTQFLLVGGIAPINAGSFASAAEAAAAALASAAPIVVICAADSAYPQLVPEIAALLRAAGAEVVLTLAGQPPEQIAALRAAGIEFFFHQRADLLLTLDALLRRTENPEPRTDP